MPSVDQPVVVPFPHPGLGTRLPGSVIVLVCAPYDVVVPYWRYALVVWSCGSTVPPIVAPLVVTPVAAPVVTTGGPAVVVNVASAPSVVPFALVASTR